MKEVTKQQRRQLMPICSKWIDEMRQEFGADQIVYIKASENGQAIEWGAQQVREPGEDMEAAA